MTNTPADIERLKKTAGTINVVYVRHTNFNVHTPREVVPSEYSAGYAWHRALSFMPRDGSVRISAAPGIEFHRVVWMRHFPSAPVIQLAQDGNRFYRTNGRLFFKADIRVRDGSLVEAIHARELCIAFAWNAYRSEARFDNESEAQP